MDDGQAARRFVACARYQLRRALENIGQSVVSSRRVWRRTSASILPIVAALIGPYDAISKQREYAMTKREAAATREACASLSTASFTSADPYISGDHRTKVSDQATSILYWYSPMSSSSSSSATCCSIPASSVVIS